MEAYSIKTRPAKTMTSGNDNVPLLRIILLLIACISVYLYLYTNVFDGMKTSSVFRVVEGDVQAVWKDKFGSVSYYLKLMEQTDKSLKIELSASGVENMNASKTTPGPTTRPPTPANTIVKTWLLDKYKSEIHANSTLPLITLFTSWNDSPSKYLVHNLTAFNWHSLRPFVIPVVFTNETNVANEVAKYGWEVMPISVAAAGGIPVLKYMYRDVMNTFNTTFYGYCNGDILFTDKLMDTLIAMINSSVDLNTPTLLVGQRTNVENVTMDEGKNWENITHLAKTRGKVFTGWAEDFFFTTRSYPWPDIAEVVIGRRAYDNWLVYNSRKLKYNVIDLTKTLLALHQTDKGGNFEGHGHENKDYNHNLLVKMYKKIKYNAGVIECIEQYSAYVNEDFKVNARVLPKACKV